MLAADVLRSATQIQVVKYVTVASMAVLVYDYFLTLEREIRLVWKSKWGLGKILYLLARYPTFFDVPLVLWQNLNHGLSPKKCLAIYTTATWATVVGIGMAEGILFLRTYALYYGNKKVLAFLISFYVVMYIVNIVIAELYVRSVRFGDPPDGIRQLGGCYAVAGDKIIFVDFCCIILQETIILSLTLYKGIQMFRRSSSQLIKTFYRDGVFYYLYIFLISAGNIIVLVVGPVDLLDLLDTFQRVMHSVLSTRILLHVREALSDSMDSREIVSDVRFANMKKAAAAGRSLQSTSNFTSTSAGLSVHEMSLPARPDL